MIDEKLTCFLHSLIYSIRFDPVPVESPVFNLLVERAVHSRQMRFDIFWDLICAASTDGNIKDTSAKISSVFHTGDEMALIYQGLLDVYLQKIRDQCGILLFVYTSSTLITQHRYCSA